MSEKYKFYSITYEKEHQYATHPQLYEEIKRTKYWACYMDTTWFVCTTETADEIFDRLVTYFPKANEFRIIISEINVKNTQGIIPGKLWKWFKSLMDEYDID